MPASAFQVFQHLRFGIVKALDLQERQRATDLVARFRLAKHQPFAAERLDARELCAEMVEMRANGVLVRHLR